MMILSDRNWQPQLFQDVEALKRRQEAVNRVYWRVFYGAGIIDTSRMFKIILEEDGGESSA